METVAMQTRCVACGREQYAPIVFLVSKGEAGCAWCGHVTGPMTEEEYRGALRTTLEKGDGPK